jgi:hypothetical protein
MGRSLPILGVPGVLGGKRILVVTTFTQSLGPQLFVNNDFPAWAGDDPTGWNRSGEVDGSEVTERDPNQLHANTKTVGGAANIFGTAQIAQSKVTPRNWHQLETDVSAYGAGPLNDYSTTSPMYLSSYTSAKSYRKLFFASHSFGYWQGYKGSAGGDVTIDRASLKKVTLNKIETMPSPDAEIVFLFTPPAAPLAGEHLVLIYRLIGTDLTVSLNSWIARLERSLDNVQWNFRLDSVANFAVTNRISVDDVGDVVGFKITCEGQNHNCWTTANGVDWTKRGAEISLNHNTDKVYIVPVYNPSFTPQKLTVEAL